jgi:hypothetical protein
LKTEEWLQTDIAQTLTIRSWRHLISSELLLKWQGQETNRQHTVDWPFCIFDAKVYRGSQKDEMKRGTQYKHSIPLSIAKPFFFYYATIGGRDKRIWPPILGHTEPHQLIRTSQQKICFWPARVKRSASRCHLVDTSWTLKPVLLGNKPLSCLLVSEVMIHHQMAQGQVGLEICVSCNYFSLFTKTSLETSTATSRSFEHFLLSLQLFWLMCMARLWHFLRHILELGLVSSWLT